MVGSDRWPFPEKKIIFVPKNDKFGCILMRFLTDRKHGQSLKKPRVTDFTVQSPNERSKNGAKNIQKVNGQTRAIDF